jgi:hypothetical protein
VQDLLALGRTSSASDLTMKVAAVEGTGRLPVVLVPNVPKQAIGKTPSISVHDSFEVRRSKSLDALVLGPTPPGQKAEYEKTKAFNFHWSVMEPNPDPCRLACTPSEVQFPITVPLAAPGPDQETMQLHYDQTAKALATYFSLHMTEMIKHVAEQRKARIEFATDVLHTKVGVRAHDYKLQLECDFFLKDLATNKATPPLTELEANCSIQSPSFSADSANVNSRALDQHRPTFAVAATADEEANINSRALSFVTAVTATAKEEANKRLEAAVVGSASADADGTVGTFWAQSWPLPPLYPEAAFEETEEYPNERRFSKAFEETARTQALVDSQNVTRERNSKFAARATGVPGFKVRRYGVIDPQALRALERLEPSLEPSALDEVVDEQLPDEDTAESHGHGPWLSHPLGSSSEFGPAPTAKRQRTATGSDDGVILPTADSSVDLT